MRTFVLAVVLTTSGCSLIGRGTDPCPRTAPEPEATSGLAVVPIELDSFYQRLEQLAAGAPAFELVRVHAGRLQLPVVHVGPVGEGERRLLVVAGLHGDEVSATLAVLSILADVRRRPDRYEGVALHVVAPANPSGLAQTSRWNAAGCDLSRDFGPFRTIETRVIADVIGSVRPDLVLALRDAPAEELRVSGSRSVPKGLVAAVTDEAVDEGIPVARSGSFLGLSFLDGSSADTGSLGVWTESIGVGTLVTRAPGASDDLRMRIGAHLAAARAAASHLRSLPPPRDRE